MPQKDLLVPSSGFQNGKSFLKCLIMPKESYKNWAQAINLWAWLYIWEMTYQFGNHWIDVVSFEIDSDSLLLRTWLNRSNDGYVLSLWKVVNKRQMESKVTFPFQNKIITQKKDILATKRYRGQDFKWSIYLDNSKYPSFGTNK